MTDPQEDQNAHIVPGPDDGKLSESKTITVSLSRIRRLIESAQPAEASSLGENQREIILIVRGVVERLLLAEHTPLVLGRTDLAAKFHPDVDMTPYGAEERGVSRAHARIHLEGRKLYVTDLGSTNGTYLAGKRLTPNQPELLGKGDEFLLGRLPIQVMF